jgi:hypothetical protein
MERKEGRRKKEMEKESERETKQEKSGTKKLKRKKNAIVVRVTERVAVCMS